MYAITGATGHTGKIVAEHLLAAGQKVRVIARHAQHLEQFTSRAGVEACVADVMDTPALTRAFAGTRAAYVMIPPNVAATDVAAFQERAGNSLAAAVAESDVGHVVMLSSMGADKAEGTGPVLGLRNLEKKLEAIAGLQVLFLRAGYFMENLLPQTNVIQSMNMLAGPLRADLPVGMVAANDVGAAAGQALLSMDFKGKSSRELQGPREVSYQEIAGIVGAAIGKPGLSYRQVPPGQLKPILIGMGMSASMADMLLEMSEALNSGYMAPLEPRSPLNTGSTTLETFIAGVFLPAYRGAGSETAARA